MNIGQLAMIGAGGYLLWMWYSRQSASPATGGGTTNPPAGGGGTTNPPATGGGATNPPATGGGTTNPPATGGGTTNPPATTGGGTTTTPQLSTAELAALAAAGNRQWAAVLDSRNVRYTVDQWNYYRVQGGRSPIDPSDMDTLIYPDVEDRMAMLTATEYLGRLQRIGLGRVQMRSPWAV